MSTKPDERKNSFEDLRAGEKVFECFEIVEKVGAGGMGTVYKAKNILMDRIVALKVVSGNKLQDKDLIRFQNEARTLSKLDHRNIAAVFDFGVALGRIPYIAMEFIDGRTMDQVLDGLPDGKMDVSSVCWLFIQICEALSHAHRKGVIHRDLKTSNIIISEDHRSKEMRAVVVDFGVAKIDTEDERHRVTTTGEFVGSPLYISPEQIGGRRADERSDIYSLGGIMFHCLAGRPPFQAETILELLNMHKNAVPPLSVLSTNHAIPPEMVDVVSACLAKSPGERPSSTDLLADRLSEIYDSLGSGTDGADADEKGSPGLFAPAILLEPIEPKHSTEAAKSRKPHQALSLLVAVLACLVLIASATILNRMGETSKLESPTLNKNFQSYQNDGMPSGDEKIDAAIGEEAGIGLARDKYVILSKKAKAIADRQNKSNAELEKAIKMLNDCLQILEHNPRLDQGHKVSLSEKLAYQYFLLGQTDKAESLFDSVAPDVANPGDILYAAQLESDFANKHMEQKNYPRAIADFKKSDRYYNRLGEVSLDAAEVKRKLGQGIHEHLGDPKSALPFLKQAKRMYESLHATHSTSYIVCLINLGHVSRLAGLNRDASQYYILAEPIARDLVARRILPAAALADNYAGLAIAERSLQRNDLCEKYCLKALKILPDSEFLNKLLRDARADRSASAQK